MDLWDGFPPSKRGWEWSKRACRTPPLAGFIGDISCTPLHSIVYVRTTRPQGDPTTKSGMRKRMRGRVRCLNTCPYHTYGRIRCVYVQALFVRVGTVFNLHPAMYVHSFSAFGATKQASSVARPDRIFTKSHWEAQYNSSLLVGIRFLYVQMSGLDDYWRAVPMHTT